MVKEKNEMLIQKTARGNGQRLSIFIAIHSAF